jgi:hypothetical protein
MHIRLARLAPCALRRTPIIIIIMITVATLRLIMMQVLARTYQIQGYLRLNGLLLR